MRQATLFAVVALMLGAVCGCIKRYEVITILPDGSVHEFAHLESDAPDLENNTAIPQTAGGWALREEVETDENGDETHVLVAHKWTAPGEPLTSSFATSDDPFADRALQFPTTVRIERRQDGTYYHFCRTYPARRWAQYEYWRDQHFSEGPIKEISQKEPDTLTDDDRSALAGALIAVEGAKIGELIEQAGEAFDSALPQDALLAAWRAATGVYDTETLLPRITAILEASDVGEQVAALDVELRARVQENVAKALTESGCSRRTVTAFLDELAAVQTDLQTTEDLGDEEWDWFAVQMPGRIVGHNSLTSVETEPVDLDEPPDDDAEPELIDLVKAMREQGAKAGYEVVAWSFDGKAIRDRDIVLMATSFVPAD